MDIGAGTGSLKRGSLRRHLRDLRRLALGGARRKRGDLATRSGTSSTRSGGDSGASPGDFEALGIAVEVVKLSPAEAAAAGWPVAGVEKERT